MFFFRLAYHLALHVEGRLGLIDLLGGDAAGIEDRLQAVIVVLDGLELHQRLVVLRRVERHEHLTLLYAVAHVDADAVDVHAEAAGVMSFSL